MNLEKNPILYAGLLQVLRRGTAEILEEKADGIFLMDTVSQGFMLVVEDVPKGISWLQKHAHRQYTLLSVFQKELVDFIRAEYGLKEVLECYQALYPLNTPPVYGHTLQIRPASETDLPTILRHYHKLSETELRQIITMENLFLAFSDEMPVGFIGEHLEGSMGLLEVFPEHRRKGYGFELEAFQIARMLQRKQLAFCQVETENTKSLALQKKLGMHISEKMVYWIF